MVAQNEVTSAFNGETLGGHIHYSGLINPVRKLLPQVVQLELMILSILADATLTFFYFGLYCTS